MALSLFARRTLGYALGSHGAADDLADIIDAGSGTLAADTKRRLHVALGNAAADDFITAVEADSEITGYIQRQLAVATCKPHVAQEIADELGS